MAEPLTRSQSLLWVSVALPIAIMVLRLTVLHPANATVTCLDAERSFEGVDFKTAVPEQPAMLMGNRRVSDWSSTPTTMRGHDVIVRTIPGLAIENLDGCFPRLIGHYQPELVVVVIDSIEDDKAAQSARDAIAGIVAQRERYGLFFDLWITTPITTPRAATGLSSAPPGFGEALEVWAAELSNVFVIDPSTALSDGEGLPDATLFWPNGDTLTAAGYKKLETALQDAINARG